ncbi:hypothetical protein OK349_12020 [Sphingomonas sp. BT-65]|uniref:hypothetical protein n=1 Tax=Sphingomonas sp. BT-65 TaxID=2989821 RepID=UPI002236727B|nr:hypothetical protein [Sphingomonas sp. BT-65]MCW4462435.1 hypothetical protein [Sphingomonas sp. BT-65]
MTSETQTEMPTPGPPRGNTLTVALTAGLIAFLAGLAVMAAVFRFGGWWSGDPLPAAFQPPAAVAPAPRPGTDVATLAAREQALAARLDALDARLRASDADARNAAGKAGKAEALMLVLSARRALDRGQPLGYIDGELRRRFSASDPQAVATVVRAASEPVTLEDLRSALDQIAPRLSSTAPGDGWWERLQREFSTLVIIRKDNAPSPHPRERLTRAKRMLGQGHVEAALAEVARLPGAQGAESWMAAAGRYIEARRALGVLEAAAMQGQAQPAPAPAAAAAPQ